MSKIVTMTLYDENVVTYPIVYWFSDRLSQQNRTHFYALFGAVGMPLEFAFRYDRQTFSRDLIESTYGQYNLRYFAIDLNNLKGYPGFKYFQKIAIILKHPHNISDEYRVDKIISRIDSIPYTDFVQGLDFMTRLITRGGKF